MREKYIVYHYCTVETFNNILKSKVLWISNLMDSNDDQEVLRTFNTLWEGVKRRLSERDLPKQLVNEAIEIIDKQYRLEIEVDPPYGICFCEKEDLLSQWNEYGDHTKGISIGFNLNWFLHHGIRQQMPHPNIIQSNAIGCEHVIYHNDAFEEKMAEICYGALKKYGVSAWYSHIRPTFKHYSAFIKNPTFEAEQEIRIVYYPMDDVDFKIKDVEVSTLKTNVRKHYEIPWVDGENSHAIESICIGHNCSLNRENIIELFNENGLKIPNCIKESECSYRVRN